MEKQFKMFKEVAVGDAVAKSGAFPQGTVTAVQRYEKTGYDEGNLYRLDLDNGDSWFGWAEREVKLQ